MKQEGISSAGPGEHCSTPMGELVASDHFQSEGLLFIEASDKYNSWNRLPFACSGRWLSSGRVMEVWQTIWVNLSPEFSDH